MRIGIFTDTYRPSMNGIVYVTEILKENFESLGHEVFIFAPGDGLRINDDDPHLIRFPALRGTFFEDQNTSLFFPPNVLKKIDELNLDVLHFLTPGQVGLMGVYAAKKLNKPVVAEYCTDLFEYAAHYKFVLPGLLILNAVFPFSIGASRDEVKSLLAAGRPRWGLTSWNRSIIKELITVLHQRCDAVIVHSRKSYMQLQSWWRNDDDVYEMQLIPTGVDAMKPPTKSQLEEFRRKWGIKLEDKVVTYVGRLGSEKNLDILIDMLERLIIKQPDAKLMYVGDFEYREKLEEKAAKSEVADRVIFTKRLPREELGTPLAATSVFAFPSLTDTQSLALNEATQAGLPVVMVDDLVSEVVKNGENGYFCKNEPGDMADKIALILQDPKLHKKMSAASKKIARQFSEINQAKKILKLYEQISANPKT